MPDYERVARAMMEIDPLTGVPLSTPPGAQEKFNKVATALMGGLQNWIETPGRAMEQGITTDQAVDWAAPTALGMIGMGRLPGVAPEGAARVMQAPSAEVMSRGIELAQGRPNSLAPHVITHDIMMDGKNRGYVTLTTSDPKRLGILSMGADIDGVRANSLGPTAIRQLREQVMRTYPNAESVYGYRTGGARDLANLPDRYVESILRKYGIAALPSAAIAKAMLPSQESGQ